jgi:hypothetical protein
VLDPALVEQANPRLSGGISELLAEAERMQRCGSWRIQHDSGEVLWSPETYRTPRTVTCSPPACGNRG